MRHTTGLALTAFAALAALAIAVAQGAPSAAGKRLPSKSIGSPNSGRLENGAHLETAAYLRYVGAYATGDAHYGVKSLVDAIDRAAREVRRRYPDAVLGVGHLSRKGGGEIEHHHSHESGRDGDLAFYLVDSLGRPVARDHFVAIRSDGAAASEPKVKFDDGRNWALIAALVSDPKAHVTHIFVATYLRTRLLAYGARVGASPALRARVAEVLMQPHHALPHDDHFHVRIACPAGSGECVENPVAASSRKAATKKSRAKPPVRKLTRARATGRYDIEPTFTERGHSTVRWPTPDGNE